MTKKWCGSIPPIDDFGRKITDTFIDGATVQGPWALMNPESFAISGRGLGTGSGQKYELQGDGTWLKTAG